MSPMFRDMDLFRNSSYTSQYFQSEDIKQIKIEFYITEDRLYNPPVSNILSFTIVPTNTDINSVSE